MTATITGVILAGGESRRMGRDKAGVEIRGHSMLEMVASAVSPSVDGVIVSGPPRDGWATIPDSVHVRGPLAGLATTLPVIGSTHALLVSVDQPFMRTATIAALTSMASELAVVPVNAEGVRQVTCALYPASLADVAHEEAMADGSIQTLLDRVSFQPVTPEIWRDWGEDGRSWFSVDTEIRLAEGIERYG